MNHSNEPLAGRFAPSPSGRMHLGNMFTALLSWLSVRAAGGRWILRIEDLDPQRSKRCHALAIEDDLRWLGLEWDEGGLDGKGPSGPYCQSMRGDIYRELFDRIEALGLLYPCRCRRADIMATQAPHQSDGRIVYAGTCRPAERPPFPACDFEGAAARLYVPDRLIKFTDRVFGPQAFNLASQCGDFVLRRADGAWAYQLAVVADDAMMGVTEVVRGHDLLLSAAQQTWLYSILGYEAPSFAHLPLLCNAEGVRLSKRDASESMEALRVRYTPEQLLGRLGHLAGIVPDDSPVSLAELVAAFSWDAVPADPCIKI